MLKYRLLMSAVLLPLFAALFYFDSKSGPLAALFGPLVMFLSAACAGELVTMVRNRVPTLTKLDVMLACVTLTFVGWAVHAGPALDWLGSERAEMGSITRNGVNPFVPGGIRSIDAAGPIARLLTGNEIRSAPYDQGIRDTPTSVYAAGMVAAAAILWFGVWLLEAAVRFEKGQLEAGQVVAHVSAKLLVLAYAGGLMAATMQMRWFGFSAWASYRLLAGVLIAVKSADIGAYAVGRTLGRRHPLKRLSPGKTGAGFVGAVVVGGVAFALWMRLMPAREGLRYEDDSLLQFLILTWIGGLLALGGVMGDLFESLLKRECGVKDSSSLIPGFGGVLDVLDSVLFVGAMVVAAAATVATFSAIALS